MEPLHAGELHIAVEAHQPHALRLLWSGKSNSRDPGSVLRPFLHQALELCAASNRGLELHFEQVEYFNSSTIAELITLLHDANTKRVALTVVYDGKQSWQELSFSALKRAVAPFQTAVSIRSTAQRP